MLASTITLLRERGGAGTTVDAVLAHSGAPRGSVYHHFPGGRAELIDTSVTVAGGVIGDLLDRIADSGDAHAGLEEFAALWRRALVDSDHRAGCPVLAVAVDDELTPSSAAIVADVLDRWHAACARLLENAGHPADRAQRLATLVVSAVEGAVVLCRVQRSSTPLDDVIRELHLLVDVPTRPGG